jgi:hypothetical protein
MIDNNPADMLKKSAIMLQNKNSNTKILKNTIGNILPILICPIRIYQNNNIWIADAYYKDPSADPTYEKLTVHIYDQYTMTALSNLEDPSTDDLWCEGFINEDATATVTGLWRRKFWAVINASSLISDGQYKYFFEERYINAVNTGKKGFSLNANEYNHRENSTSNNKDDTDTNSAWIPQPVTGTVEMTEEIVDGNFIYTFCLAPCQREFNAR